MSELRRHPALLLLAAFVAASVAFIACSGGDRYGDRYDDVDRGPVSCTPGSVRRCRGPSKCLGEQACLPNGKAYGACVCTWRPTPKDASPPEGDACEVDGSDAPSSNDAAGDAPSSNDAAGDAPSSNDADGPSSNDAADDAPSSNGWGSFELPDWVR